MPQVLIWVKGMTWWRWSTGLVEVWYTHAFQVDGDEVTARVVAEPCRHDRSREVAGRVMLEVRGCKRPEGGGDIRLSGQEARGQPLPKGQHLVAIHRWPSQRHVDGVYAAQLGFLGLIVKAWGGWRGRRWLSQPDVRRDGRAGQRWGSSDGIHGIRGRVTRGHNDDIRVLCRCPRGLCVIDVWKRCERHGAARRRPHHGR